MSKEMELIEKTVQLVGEGKLKCVLKAGGGEGWGEWIFLQLALQMQSGSIYNPT